MGEVCADQVCLSVARSGAIFSVMVFPPAGSTLIPDQFVGVEVDSGGMLDLTLTEPVEVRGVVAFAPDKVGPVEATEYPVETLETVGGLLVATAPGWIPGTSFRSEASVQTQQKIGQDWTFLLRLLPGVPYSITFVPDSDPARGALAHLPTHTFFAQFSKSESGVQLLLPSKSEYLQASLQGVVVLDEAGSTPVRGAKVSVVGNGTKGSTATTDEQGVFRVLVPPGAGTLTVRVEPGKGSPLFPIREFHYAEGLSEIQNGATPRFVVGPVPPLRDILVQVFSVVGQTLEPVPQARVEAEGKAGGGATFGYTVTGADGVARLTLLQGVYALAVIPPAGSTFASQVSVLDLETNPGSNVFHVPLSRRTTILGRVVRDDDGTPVAGAVVTLQSHRIAALAGTSHESYEMTASTVSDAQGAFEVLLDPGIYALTVIPHASSGLARFGQPEVDLTTGDALVTVRLVRGAVVRGRMVAAGTGEPISGAQVQFFFDVSGGSFEPAFSGATYAAAIQAVGSATTGSDGRYMLVVPHIEGRQSETRGDGTGYVSPSFGLPAVEVNPESASP